MSLYAIHCEMETIIEAILEGGADSAEAQAALDAHLADLDAALDAKADDYAALITSLNARAAARSIEAKRMRQLADADEALADRLKERLKTVMETTGRTKIDTARFRLSVAGNGGKQPLVIDADPATLPKHLTAVRVEADKEAIRAALEGGATIPGCTLLPRGTSLRIR